MNNISTSHPVILFDGVCNLCNGFVQWLIRRDGQALFRYASLQSDAGQELLRAHGLGAAALNTVIMVYRSKVYTHSDVPLEIARLLGGLWWPLYAFKLVPRQLRDAVYNFVARNRYRWFGRQESCMVPTPELKERFL